jgi:hypothetical protein
MQSACAVLYYYLWPVLLYHIFPYYHKTAWFWGKIIEHRMRFLIFSKTFAWNILRRIQRDIVINVHRSSCTVPFILLEFEWNLNFLHRFLKNIPTQNFIKIRAVGADLFHADGKTDRRTDGRLDGQTSKTSLMIVFRDFGKTPKNSSLPKFIGGTLSMFRSVPHV